MKFDDDIAAAKVDAEFTETTRLVSSVDDADHVLIIDVANLAYRSAFGNATLATSDGRPSGHVFGSLKSLVYMFESVLPAGKWLMVRCHEGAGAKAWRRQFVPNYKTRPERWDPKQDVVDALEALPGYDVTQANREGDDAVAGMVGIMHQFFPREAVTVYSGDKDLWALLGETNIYSPNKGGLVDGADLWAKFSLKVPQKLPLLKAICGDSGDTIVGVDRFRKKVAGEACDYLGVHDVETLYEFLRAGKLSKKTAANMEERFEEVQMNFRATTLYPQGFADCITVRPTGDPRHLLEVIARYESPTLEKHVAALTGAGSFTVWGEK